MSRVLAPQGLVWILQNDVTVMGLVGARVYPVQLPQGATLPAITYQKVSGVREQVHGGHSALAKPRYQVTCWAESFASSQALAKATRIALNGVTGEFGDPADGEAVPMTLVLLNEMDASEPQAQNYQVVQDYLVLHREDVT